MHKNEKCRFCGNELKHTFIDLGLSPLSNEYVAGEALEYGQRFFPLNVQVCENCYLVQAMEYQNPEKIFSDYKYFSSFSESWLKHCKEYVEMIVPRLGLNSDSMVVEVACNDGALLKYFLDYQIPVCGVDPAENATLEARKMGIAVENMFFNADVVPLIEKKYGKADLLIGNNVLAHVPDINGFVEGFKQILKPEGVVTLEFPHLMKLMEYVQFDTIYHEHFSYLSLSTVKKIFYKHGLKIFDVEELSTHGGSLRVYAAHLKCGKHEVRQSVEELLEKEKRYGLLQISTYEKFREKVKKVKRDSVGTFVKLKNEGKKIAAFGAAAKGNTFLNYCGIGRDYIDYVVDSNTEKQGNYLPGTLIPIVDIEKIRETKPDYIVILPWNLEEEIVGLLDFTRDWGCKFMIMIPEVRIF